MPTATHAFASETLLIEVPAGAPVPEVVADSILVGETYEPDRLPAAVLRHVAGMRTPAGRISAQSKRAAVELARRKTNRQAKKG